MAKMKKPRNYAATEATLINIRALKPRVRALEQRTRALELAVNGLMKIVGVLAKRVAKGYRSPV